MNSLKMFFLQFIYLMCMSGLHVCLCAMCILRPEERVRALGTEVTGGLELSHRCLDLDGSHLQDKTLLTQRFLSSP